jgi:DNA-binding transcriptional LysR family regulator
VLSVEEHNQPIGAPVLNDDDVLAGLSSVLKTAREGSFRGAMRNAKKGFRTLQNEINALEAELGILIFRRTRDGVFPTRDGQIVIEKAKALEGLIADIRRLGKSLKQDEEGEVSVAVTEGLGTFWISPRLHSFNEQNKGISIMLHPSMAITDMRRFEIDLAIQVIEPILPEIKRVRIGTLHLMLAASPSYIEKHGEPKSVQDLASHTFIFHTSPQSSDRLRIEEALGHKLTQSQSIVMRNSSAHYMTIDHGLGIGFIPSYGFPIGINLVPLAVPVRYALDIWLCFHADSRSNTRVAKAIDWFIAAFDPRLYPWFRREFLPPSAFDAIIENNGITNVMQSVSLRR